MVRLVDMSVVVYSPPARAVWGDRGLAVPPRVMLTKRYLLHNNAVRLNYSTVIAAARRLDSYYCIDL